MPSSQETNWAYSMLLSSSDGDTLFTVTEATFHKVKSVELSHLKQQNFISFIDITPKQQNCILVVFKNLTAICRS